MKVPQAEMNQPTLVEKLRASLGQQAPAVGKPKPQAYKPGKDPTVKVALFGPIGSGKTTFLLGPLLCGERLLTVSTDFGGNGLISVINQLDRIQRLDLVENVLNIDLTNYSECMDFLKSPIDFIGSYLEEFDPTVLVWDGFSTFQIDYVDEETETNPRLHGLNEGDKFAHWYDVKRASLRVFSKFFAFTLPDGKRLHKILTCMEAKPDTNDLTNVTEKAALLQGGVKDLAAGGFDVVLNCYSVEKVVDQKVTFDYFYRTQGATGKYAVKNRGFALNPIEPAEPERIWRVLTGKS